MKRQLLRLIYAFYQGIIDFTEAETLQRNLNWQSFAASANVPSRSAVTKNLTGYSQMCETLNLDFRCFAVKFCLFTCFNYIIGAHGTDVSVEIRLLSGETLLQVKNLIGRRWDSNPGPCRYLR